MTQEKLCGDYLTVGNPKNLRLRLEVMKEAIDAIMHGFDSFDEGKITNREYIIKEMGDKMTVGVKFRYHENLELKDTVELMTSENWQDRFIAEYEQTKIRYEKLHNVFVKREAGKLDFETPIPIESWKAQLSHMGKYLFELEKQAAIHGIKLPKI